MSTITKPGKALAAAVTIATSLFFSACSGDPDSSATPDDTSAPEATEIIFWSWLPDIQKTIDLFEVAHPDIHVTLENVGSGEDEYTKIQNAVDAGAGGPDVAQMTYEAIPNFSLTGALADLTKTGGAAVADRFLPGVVELVSRDGGIYGVPQDFGPGVLYYRADVLEEAGIEVPATWDEFKAAAEKLKAHDPTKHITYLDPGLAAAAYMGLWQLQSDPWTAVSQTELEIDLNRPGSIQWADYWSDLNARDLVIQSKMGSDEWFKQMGAGQIATWLVGAWGLQALTGNLPDNAGLWRVAPQPVWTAGDKATSQFGGSATVVIDQSKKKAAATTFALWLNSDPVAVESLKNDQGLLPATTAAWADDAFLDEEIAYLGGQPARQIFAQSALDTAPGWEWLPFQPYVSSIYADTVGQEIAAKGSIAAGFQVWQERIIAYAKDQGFTVK
ncbi:MAG: extracellular solute-binding protein [Propionibacteriaceae bacterium]|jgi:multiple sugar transport system substrate-binding protein|nr:extracellular solute-binding protein [Propionibacteriaceae bacterium]